MKKHLFFTGPAGWGKTAAIRAALGDRISMAGGFITERVLKADGSLSREELSPAAAAGGVPGFEPLCFLVYDSASPKTDNEVFRKNGVQLLQEAEYYPFSVLDQFGGFELIIPQFREALADILSSEQPCIGAFMPLEEAQQLRLRLGLGEKYLAYHLRLQEALYADPDTVIYELREKSDPIALRLAQQWAKEYAT